MEEEESCTLIKKPKTIHYGSLEEQEKFRLTTLKSTGIKMNSDKKEMALHVNVSKEYLDISHPIGISRDKQSMLEEFERRRKARQIQVSTDDIEVKKNLRELGEPICLFGEGPADRRTRLRETLAKMGENALRRRKEEESGMGDEEKQETTWYHEGPDSLRIARLWIAEYSLPRSKARLEAERKEKALPNTTKNARKQELHKRIRALGLCCSQIGDVRPVSFCEFSPNSQILATGSWSGVCKLWSIPDCKVVRVLCGHQGNVGAIVFHPQATLTLDDKACCLASCAGDGSVKLWNLISEEPIADIEGHAPYRVSRVRYHPSGRFLATCVFDHSWRLWDLEQQAEVLHQEGHSQPVFDITFQVDGSLAATCGWDSFGRLWDLRTGRCIMFMEGHLRKVLAIAFNHNGYQLATGGEDHTCRLWDLRMRQCIYTLPAHNNLVSSIKFPREQDNFMVTVSYDCVVNIWSHPLWQPLKSLHGHDSKIMYVDISPNDQYIATSSFDHTFKLWTQDESGMQ